MPNWCANSLKLVATNAQSEKLLANIVQELARAHEANESANIFALIKPIPEALHITSGWLGKDTPEQAALEAKQKENLAIYGYKDWYDFCIAEWGTKWDAKTGDEDLPFTIEDNKVTIYFDTAWAPPMNIYYTLEEMGFELEATYIEQGMGYIGYYTDGVDTCEKMEQFYTADMAEDEDDFPVINHKIDQYFEAIGFDHMPTNLGG
jgi:hypothetical protein